MKTPKIKTPASQSSSAVAPTAVPLPDSPELIDVKRRERAAARNREGAAGSLLSGGMKGDISSGNTTKKTLGSGSMAY